tara:strand:+ start:4931 stop:5101 length:171 start_codon:yes stop_codon:yes gene_type:complete
MFEPDKEEINKKCVKFFTLQSNLLESCKNLKDFTQKIKEKNLKTMVKQNKERKTSM